MKSALLFSGQGSQYVGMASDLYSTFPSVATLVDQANSIVEYSLSDVMFGGPDELLRETRYTQPALFVHEAALLSTSDAWRVSSAVAGHSLGEYSALYAAGVLSFEDALRLVQLRANLMWNAGKQIPGTMAAIVGMNDEDVIALCDELNGVDGNVISAANFNSPGQVVISGSAEYVRQCLPRFKERGAKIAKELQVSGAFHSVLLNAAKEPLSKAISETRFSDASMNVHPNVTGRSTTDAVALKELVALQLTQPVLFTETLNNLKLDGYDNFVEIGPGKVLQGLVKRTLSDVTVSGVDTAVDAESMDTKFSAGEASE